MIDDGQRAAFAAWAATEGITKVGFSPVKALGRTVGNVWGERDHHLVLLDREWGIWQASQASRPREAAVAPEACPVAWAVVDRHGVVLPNSIEAAEIACLRTKDEADEELTYANQGEGAPPWEGRKPFRVVPLYAHPASATAEAKCGTCGGTGPDRPHIQTRTFFGNCPDAFHGSFPATPATPVCPRCRGGGLVILADLPLEGRICGGRCPCGASLGTPKDKPS